MFVGVNWVITALGACRGNILFGAGWIVTIFGTRRGPGSTLVGIWSSVEISWLFQKEGLLPGV